MRIKSLILLKSEENDQTITRRYDLFSDINEMAKHCIKQYEDYLFAMEIGSQELKYSSKELFKFLNYNLGELVCLRLNEETSDLWEPMPKDWILECVYHYLKGIAHPGPSEQPMEVS